MGFSPQSLRSLNIVIFGLILYGLGTVAHDAMLKWETFNLPYSFIAGFYRFTILSPIESIGDVWGWGRNLSQYPNLNVLLVIAISVAYCCLLLFALVLMMGVVGYIGIPFNVQITIIFLPFLVFIFWYPSDLFLSWLFTT